MNYIKEGEKFLEPDKPMKDFESITVGQEMLMIKKKPKLCKLMDLPANVNCLQVNLYSSVLQTEDGTAIKVVVMAA